MKDEDAPKHEGYYWVRRSYNGYSQWQIGYWRSEEYWEAFGESSAMEFDEVVEVGPEVETPPNIHTDYIDD